MCVFVESKIIALNLMQAVDADNIFQMHKISQSKKATESQVTYDVTMDDTSIT